MLVDPDDGTVLTGVADGRVLRLHPRNGTVSVVADTGGRPMGLEWLPDGRLLVCDARRGLLAIDTHSGTTEVLATQVAGQTLGFCNSASVAPDGTIWFSDSSSRFGIDVWKADILEHSGTGRLLRRDVSGECEVVTDGLQFANGVALTDDPTHVVVAETGSYALSTCPTRPGTHRPTPLLTNLPGFPDNIATGTDGLIWVALASPRDVVVDALASLPGLLRQIVWALPEAVQPQPANQVWVVAVDPGSGHVVHDLQGSHPQFGMTTGFREHAGTVWLGSLVGTTVACFDVPAG